MNNLSPFRCITKAFFPALLLVLIISLAASQNSFCDEIGPGSECIQKNDRQLDQDRYWFSYVFQMEKTSVFESTGGQANFQIFNFTLISGTWRGSFNISSNDTTIKSGAKFRPENGNIVIGTKLPEGDIEFPSSSLPTGCQDVKYRNQSASSGVYEIDPDGEGGVSPFKVYCEINSEGGWIKLETAGYLHKQDGESFGCGSRNNVFVLSKTGDYSDLDPDTSTNDYYNLGGGGGNYGPQYDGNGNQITQQVSTVDGFCSGDTLDFMGFDDGRVSGGIRYSERPTEWTDMDVDYYTVDGGVGELNESQEEAIQSHIDSVSQRTEMFAQTSDDDGDTNGEVFVKSYDGIQRHLTPWDTGSENNLNDDHDYFHTGETDEDSNHIRQLDSKFILPDKISFYNGGDHSGDSHPISWGYEKRHTLVNDFAISCKEVQNRAPQASSGTYRIDPDGAGGVAPFDVYCEMDQDGGGWIKLRISNHESDRVVTNDHGGSYGFQDNCGSYDGQDDKYYRGTDDLTWSKSTNTGETTYDVDYSSGGNSLSESQEQALRDIAKNISGETRSVSLTCDDDGDSKSGHEVTLTDGSGDTFTTTSQTDVSGSGYIGFWVHSTDKAENTFDAIDTTFTGSGPANRSLPQDFIMPAKMTADINSGGAVAWGYEQDYVLVK